MALIRRQFVRNKNAKRTKKKDPKAMVEIPGALRVYK